MAHYIRSTFVLCFINMYYPKMCFLSHKTCNILFIVLCVFHLFTSLLFMSYLVQHICPLLNYIHVYSLYYRDHVYTLCLSV